MVKSVAAVPHSLRLASTTTWPGGTSTKGMIGGVGVEEGGMGSWARAAGSAISNAVNNSADSLIGFYARRGLITLMTL